MGDRAEAAGGKYVMQEGSLSKGVIIGCGLACLECVKKMLVSVGEI